MLAIQPTARVLMFGGLLVMAALLAIPLSSHLGLHAPLRAPSSPRVSAKETQRPPPLRLAPGGLLLAPPEMPSASADVPLTPPWPPELMLVSPDTAHSLGKIRGGSFAKADVPASAPTSEPEIGGLRKAPSLGPSQGLHPPALTQNTPTVPSKPWSASSRPVPPSVQAPLPTLPVLANTLEDDAIRIHQDRGKLEQLPVGKIFLHAPIAMTLGDKRSVNARVGVNVPDDILKGYALIGNQTVEGSLRVSHHMIATLSGAGFEIKRTTPEEETIAEGFPTVWEWEIEAKMAGAQELEAALYVLPADGSDTPERHWIASYLQRIDVSVRRRTWSEWLKSVSEELDAVKAISVTIGGIGAAAVGWFGISLTRRQKQRRATRRKSKRQAVSLKGATPLIPAFRSRPPQSHQVH
jgi:hypothetical protein